MSQWPATKAQRVLAALERTGWVITRTKGSHKLLVRPGSRPYWFTFHESVEIGPKALARIGKKTGLTPEDL